MPMCFILLPEQVETGMFLPFASRVATAKLTVQTLLDVFAKRFA